jgi:hypothetical protein
MTTNQKWPCVFLIKYPKKISNTRNDIAGLLIPLLKKQMDTNVKYPNMDEIIYVGMIFLCR